MSFAVEHIPKASHTPPRKLHSPANDEVGTASLSVGRAHNGTLEVHSVLPDGVVVGTGKYGRCLVAHKHFPEGSVIYRTYGALIDMAPAGREREGKEDPPMTEKSSPCASGSRDEDDGDDGDDDDDSALMGTSCSEGSMTTTTNDGTDNGDADADVDATTTKFLLHVYGAEDGELVESFLLDDTNSVKDYFHPSEDRRQVYGFDGFMNHSCSPNCHAPLIHRSRDFLFFETIAERDIYPGDEITCDYALFDYECDGHEIAECGCGSTHCRGKMLGFKHLTLNEKVRIMHRCEEEVVDRFFEDNPDVVLLQRNLPGGVALKDDSGSNTGELIASREFEAGEVVHTNRVQVALALPEEEEWNDDKTYIVKVRDRYLRLNRDEQTPCHPSEHAECPGSLLRTHIPAM